MNNYKIPITIIPNVQLGLTVAVLNPSVLSATAGIEFDCDIDCNLNLNKAMQLDDNLCPECSTIPLDAIEYGNVNASMWLRSATTFIGFTTSEYKYKLLEINNINQLSF